jgi:hypothetical protein
MVSIDDAVRHFFLEVARMVLISTLDLLIVNLIFLALARSFSLQL